MARKDKLSNYFDEDKDEDIFINDYGMITKKELTHLDEIKNTLSKITGLEIGNITDTQYLELLQLASSYKNIQLNSYKDIEDFRASVLVEIANIYAGSKAKYPILRQIKNILKLN